MEAVTALIGALIGGVLVLVGEAFRRRAEVRQRAVDRLINASADLAMVINRACGEMVDAKFGGLARPPDALRADRHEAATRFFMTPAPPDLQEAARTLSHAYHDLYDHYDDEGWSEAWENYKTAIRRFEAAVRTVASAGFPGRSLRAARRGIVKPEEQPSWRAGTNSHGRQHPLLPQEHGRVQGSGADS
ncbi:hypothetical protein ACIBM8_30915 [Micromonospora aurantiaca]|uniref:hypothetical protein n=1 Tax=Micromonospora aurantiaca (nom. illeg.) TaxID=47850 RepID=UPI0037A4B2C6